MVCWDINHQWFAMIWCFSLCCGHCRESCFHRHEKKYHLCRWEGCFCWKQQSRIFRSTVCALNYDAFFGSVLKVESDRWFQPVWKYEFVSWDDDIPNIWRVRVKIHSCSKPPTSWSWLVVGNAICGRPRRSATTPDGNQGNLTLPSLAFLHSRARWAVATCRM